MSMLMVHRVEGTGGEVKWPADEMARARPESTDEGLKLSESCLLSGLEHNSWWSAAYFDTVWQTG